MLFSFSEKYYTDDTLVPARGKNFDEAAPVAYHRDVRTSSDANQV